MIASVLIALGVVFVCVYHYFFKDRKGWEQISKIPGPKTVPIFGNALQIKSGHEYFSQGFEFREEFSEYGMCRVMFGQKPFVWLWKPDYVEALTGTTKHIEKSLEYRLMHPWLGLGLLNSKGEKWHTRRKMLTPTFHFNILRDFVDVFNKQSRTLVRKFAEKAPTGTFDVHTAVTYCTLDIICEAAMGVDIDAQNKDTDYVKAVLRMSTIVMDRFRQPWYWNDVIFSMTPLGREHKSVLNTLHSFTKSVIADRLQTFDEKQEELVRQELSGEKADHEESGTGKKRRLAFLDMLLYMSDHLTTLSMEDVREEVDTFMFEGHDTTAAAVMWTIHLIGADPEVQDKVHQELDAIFGNSDRDATMEDLTEMKYLECCIKESLRILPSVPSFARCVGEDLQLGDFTIPKGTTVLVLVGLMHRDPQHFPDPEVFKPERFFKENTKDRHPFCYIPFSAGPRNCIGQRFAMMEEKTILSHVFRNFSVKSMQSRDELRPVPDLILRPEKNILVQMTPRQTSSFK